MQTKRTRSELIRSIIVVMLIFDVIGFGAYFFLKLRAPEKIQDVNAFAAVASDEFKDWQTYRNEEYGFEFRYPSDYIFETSKDYKGNDWRYKLTSQTKEILTISREDNRFPELDTFDKFAVDRSEAYCAADGPHGSVYCTDENRKSEFTNPAGIAGYEIYLNETTQDYATNQKTTRIKGPIFVLDFSPLNNPDAKGMFLNREGTFSKKEIIT